MVAGIVVVGHKVVHEFASYTGQISVIAAFAVALNRFGDGEQNDAIVDGVQAVAGGGDDEVIAGAAVGAGVGTGQPNPPVQHLQRGLAGALVIIKAGAGGQGNQGLSQRTLVPAVHGVRAATAVDVTRGGQMLSGKRGQRDVVQRGCPGSQ